MTRNIQKYRPSLPFRILTHGVAWVLFSFATTGCHHFSGNASAGDVPSSVIVQKIAIIDSAFRYFDSLTNQELVRNFYFQHHFVPVWWEHKKPSAHADTLFHFISASRNYGLLPQHYHFENIRRLLADTLVDDDVVRQTDLYLTDAFISICRDLKYGRRSHDIIQDSLLRYKADSWTVANLRLALTKGEIRNTFQAQEPDYEHYKQLKAQLQTIIAEADPATKRKLYLGELPDSSALAAKVVALEINMDRWRSEQSIGGRHILVNIPGCYLQVIEGDSISFATRVIVGTAKNQTPELDGLIRSFIIYPYWNVPRSIAVNEILPQVKKDQTYLANHRYEVLDVRGGVLSPDSIKWDVLHINNFPYTIRQQQGVHNALGLVKFWFNNPYAVFLHDTNARLLFDRKMRALSHGCVRVEKAMELGRHLLRGSTIISPEDLDQYLELQQQMTVKITEAIPVHIRYLTCAYRGGTVEYFPDIYGEDKVIFEKMYSKPVVEAEMFLAQGKTR